MANFMNKKEYYKEGQRIQSEYFNWMDDFAKRHPESLSIDLIEKYQQEYFEYCSRLDRIMEEKEKKEKRVDLAIAIILLSILFIFFGVIWLIS